VAGNLGALQAEIERLGEVEKRVLATFNAAIQKAQKQQLSDPELARIIEQEMLPEWRAARERLSAINPVPGVFRQRLADLLEYMKLRQEGWELLARGARESNLQKISEANAKQAAAEALARKLAGNEKP
jgi:hypothetical protein